MLLEIRGVSYGVLREISLDVDEGETLVLLGRSGCGKTTLLKAVIGLVRPVSGEIRLEGKPATEWDPVRLRRRMGYVIQEGGLFPHWTVEANVGLAPRLDGWAPQRIAARVEELLRLVGLDPAEYGGRYPRQLSGGQRQRVGIARALAGDPPLLLLDEPFGALDPITRLDLQKQFLELRRGLRKAAIFVTHDVREALLMGSRIALLKDGALQVLAPPADFVNSPSGEARAFLAGLDVDWRQHEL